MRKVLFNETRHLLPKLRIRAVSGGILYGDQKVVGVEYENEKQQLASGEIIARGGEREVTALAVRDTVKGRFAPEQHPLAVLKELH